MTTAKILLAVLLVALTIGGIVLWQSDLHNQGKIILTVVDAILWFAAVLTLLINVFSLDAQGRIPYNSLAWKYFSLAYRETGPDGNRIVVMPDKIKTCPMYWFIVWGIFLSIIALAIGSFMVYLFYVIVNKYADGAINAFDFTTDMFIWALFITFFLSIYKSTFPTKINKFWPIYLGAASLVMVILVAGFLISSVFASGVTILDFLLKAGLIVVGALAGLVVLAVLLTLLSCAVMLIFSRLRQTLFGQLIGSLYGNLCPVIPVEPAPKK